MLYAQLIAHEERCPPTASILVATCPKTHKVACSRAINYQQASSLVPQATGNRTCSCSCPYTCSSSSSCASPSFKKLSATKCSCLLTQSLAGKTAIHTPPPQPNCVSFVVATSESRLPQSKQQQQFSTLNSVSVIVLSVPHNF